VPSEHPVDELQVGSDLAGVTRPASRHNHHYLRLERYLRKVLKDVEGFAFGDVVVAAGLGKLAQELEDLGRGRTVPLVVHPEGLGHILLAPTQSTGLAPRVDNRLVVQRVGLAIEHDPVVRVVHHDFGRHHPSRWRRGCLSRPPLRLRTGCEGELRREPRVNTPGQLSRRQPDLEGLDSSAGVVPALAGFAGLLSEPSLLYEMIGFDALHVSWAPGVLRHLRPFFLLVVQSCFVSLWGKKLALLCYAAI